MKLILIPLACLLSSELGYSAIPLFFIAEGANEVFIDTGSRIIPLNLFYPGSILGLFETLDSFFQKRSHAIWSVSAGARSLFMLPKLNESSGYKRLRGKFLLPSSMKLQNASDHWNLFRNIAMHSPQHHWNNKILIFGKKWFQHQKDPAWLSFYQYLFEQGWDQAQFASSKIELSIMWENFLDALTLRRIKPSSYLAWQVKHLMLIALGKWPAFCPAHHSEEIAPLSLLQIELDLIL